MERCGKVSIKFSAPSFAVVVPMYNETLGAKKCVLAVLNSLKSIENNSLLIIVNDGSVDNTNEELLSLKNSGLHFRCLNHEINKGYGRALQTGIKTAIDEGYEYILFMDSDLTNDPSDISKFVQKMNEGVNVIKATRYSEGGGIDGVPFYRWIISWTGNKLAKVLFRLPISDCTNGFRAVKSSLLKGVSFSENDFSIIMEELYVIRQSAKSYANIPVRLTNRAENLKPSSFVYSPKVFIRYLKYPVKSFFELESN